MKDRLIITITDVHGSKQYNLHQFVRRIVLYFSLFLVALILLGGVSIRLLLSEVKQIQERRDSLIQEYADTLEKNEQLRQEIEQKSEELITISDRVEDLEGIIGVQKDEESSSDLSLIERVDLASITGVQKGFVMRLIPNGYPINSNQVSADYGWRIHPILKRREFHTGIDLRAPVGTPVYAAADGVVDFSRSEYNGGYGNLVKIDHSFGFKTFYAHLSKLIVKKGDFVKKGQLIAYSGNTGMSSGPHLHYEIRFLGNHLDPRPFIDWTMKDYTNIFEKETSVKWQSLLTTINNLMEIQAPRSSPAEPR
ncbi:MAG: peptidoglycan DD-metalloendopeptidase family protein [Wolinella sp.]